MRTGVASPIRQLRQLARAFQTAPMPVVRLGEIPELVPADVREQLQLPTAQVAQSGQAVAILRPSGAAPALRRREFLQELRITGPVDGILDSRLPSADGAIPVRDEVGRGEWRHAELDRHPGRRAREPHHQPPTITASGMR